MKEKRNLFILGDSYSTFEGHVPEGYDCWYIAAPTERVESDVIHPRQTWWWQLIEQTGWQLVRNESYSATTVCHTGYRGENCSHKSFVGRFRRLVEEGYFEEHEVDTLIIFGGTNDSWADAPLGEEMLSGWQEKDLFFVLPAFSYLLHLARTRLPGARILAVLNTGLKPEITEGFLSACAAYGVKALPLVGVDKTYGHPNASGMRAIKEQILAALAEG